MRQCPSKYPKECHQYRMRLNVIATGRCEPTHPHSSHTIITAPRWPIDSRMRRSRRSQVKVEAAVFEIVNLRCSDAPSRNKLVPGRYATTNHGSRTRFARHIPKGQSASFRPTSFMIEQGWVMHALTTLKLLKSQHAFSQGLYCHHVQLCGRL